MQVQAGRSNVRPHHDVNFLQGESAMLGSAASAACRCLPLCLTSLVGAPVAADSRSPADGSECSRLPSCVGVAADTPLLAGAAAREGVPHSLAGVSAASALG